MTIADVIVILGASLKKDQTPSDALAHRLDKAGQLYHQGRGKYLLCCGGLSPVGICEAVAMREYLLGHSSPPIPSENIITEEQSQSTFENGRYGKAIIFERHWQRLMIVSDIYHLPRCWLVFYDAQLHIECVASQLPKHIWGWGNWFKNALKEIPAFIFYCFKLFLRF